METIFEHNVTANEKAILIDDSSITKEEYLSYGFSQNQCYTGIYKLYSIRKEQTKAKMYLDKFPNTITKLFTICNHDFSR